MSRKKKSSKVVVKRVFEYKSECCNEVAKKPPVERSSADRKENKYSECGLGHWHCSKCGKNCKVKRGRVKEETSGQPAEGTGVN